MARITVEDCVEIIPNRFKLVLLAARRAREIAAGAALTVSRDNDKNPVIALREIAEKTISFEAIQESLIQTLQRHFIRDEAESEMDIVGWEEETESPSDPSALALADLSREEEEEDFVDEEGDDLSKEAEI